MIAEHRPRVVGSAALDGPGAVAPLRLLDHRVRQRADAVDGVTGGEELDELGDREDHLPHRLVLLDGPVHARDDAQVAGAPISSAVTIAGPSGEKVSKPLQFAHCMPTGAPCQSEPEPFAIVYPRTCSIARAAAQDSRHPGRSTGSRRGAE